MATITIPVKLASTGLPFPHNWCVQFPPPQSGNLTVAAGQTDEIEWVLTAPPDSPVTAAISEVAFANSQPGGHPWAGPVPSAPDWKTEDHNSLTSVDPAETWAYTVLVTYKTQTYGHDPQIVNDPPTIARSFTS